MKNFVLLVLLFGVKISYISTDCDSLDVDVTIRHAVTLYVLEGNYFNASVTLEVAKNTPNQKWRLVPSRKIGRFNIVNMGQNETALDLNGGFDQNGNRFDVALNVYTDVVTQQWFIHADGSIANGALENYALRYQRKGYTNSYELVVAPLSSDRNGRFFFDYE